MIYSLTQRVAWAVVLLGGIARIAEAQAPAPGPTTPAPQRAVNSIQAKLEALRSRPNIIFILADDLGYGDLGCYGQKKIRTPELDQLAAEGMRFTQCYAGTTVCAPSRASLMTGLHTGHTRIRGNAAIPLGTNETTVAEILKLAGYQTACIGKWGLGLEKSGSTPPDRGFDEFFGYLSQTLAHDYYPTTLWRASRPMEEPLQPANLGGFRGTYSHDLFTMAATNYVRVAQYRPFFLYLPYTIPHANNELKEKGMQVPSDEPYARENWPQPEKNKAAMITRLDRDVGLIKRELKSLNIESNTVIFFTSDNGPHQEGGVKANFFASAGPLRGIKRDMTEGGIRVPMIAHWPGHIQGGSVSDQVWAFWDFLPTAAALARTNPPPNLDGLSFLPTLLGQKQTNQHEFLYWEFHEKGSRQAVRMGDWKAIRTAVGQPLELYNLKKDLGETNNVASAQPAVIKKIEAFLKSARTPSERWPLQIAQEEAASDLKRGPDPN